MSLDMPFTVNTVVTVDGPVRICMSKSPHDETVYIISVINQDEQIVHELSIQSDGRTLDIIDLEQEVRV